MCVHLMNLKVEQVMTEHRTWLVSDLRNGKLDGVCGISINIKALEADLFKQSVQMRVRALD